MLAYRITHKNYSGAIFTTGIDGRWNSGGRRVLYAAESIPLAFLENMVRRKGLGFNDEFRTMVLEFPDDLPILTILVKDLPAGWRSASDYSKCQPIGNKWYDTGTIPILKVPSAVLQESFNYVLNASHPKFSLVKIAAVTLLTPDEPIEDILKGKTRL